jgi:hypothetical protein
MNEFEAKERFLGLCAEAVKIGRSAVDYETEIEPVSEEILVLLSTNPKLKAMFIEQLKAIISSYRTARETGEVILPVSVIAYCMHELRWAEIFDFCKKENVEFYSQKQATTLVEIIDAFNDDWEDKIFYRRYRA